MMHMKRNSFDMPRIKNLIACFLLGFSSGLPLSLVTTTLQAWFSVSKVPVVEIGLLSLVAQPYAYKFIWAPYIDRYRLISSLSYRKDWIICMQIAIACGCCVLACFDPKTEGFVMASLAFCLALLSATQDIAIDAYRAESLSEKIRGLGASIAISGYRTGLIISGGLTLILADHFGWKVSYQFNALCLCFGSLGLYLGPNLTQPAFKKNFAYFDFFKEFFSRLHWITLLLLILSYRLGETFTDSLSGLLTTFLLRELNLSLTTVGWLIKLIGISTMILGGLLGGTLMLSLSLYRALLYFGYLQAFSNLLFVWLASTHPSVYSIACVITVENICSGLGTSAFIAFLMAICDRRFTASQFAFFSALAACSRIFFVPFYGYFVQYGSWKLYFWMSFIAALPAIVILHYSSKRFFKVLAQSVPERF